MQKIKNTFFKIFPGYSIIPLAFVFVLLFVVYNGTKLITGEQYHYSLSSIIDHTIPLVPSFIFVYVGCYAQWITNYILSAHINKSHFVRFIYAVSLGYVICGIIFIILPTTIARPDVSNVDGVAGSLLQMIYSADTPVNLFPSTHCLISWYSWIAVRGQKNINKAYRCFSLVIAILVCISTVAVKQHFVIDIVGGLVIAEITWHIAKLFVSNKYKMEKA